MTQTDGITVADIICTGEPLEFFIDQINAAHFNESEFVPVYEELSKNQFEIIQNDEDYIVGKVVATDDKSLLFLSIPYESEWRVYVDGRPCDSLYSVLGDAFMAIGLTPGEHIVSMQYVEKWSTEGAVISLVSLVIFCGLVLMNTMKRNNSFTSNEMNELIDISDRAESKEDIVIDDNYKDEEGENEK